MKKLIFWGRDENDENLINQVISGIKTATCTPKAWYYDQPEEEPIEFGDLVAVYNAKGVQRCIIQITENYEIPFGKIGEKVSMGEGYDTLEEYIKDHIWCWKDDLKKDGHELNEDTEIVVEHFKLIDQGCK
jgi:uncharacterized protein YhfF